MKFPRILDFLKAGNARLPERLVWCLSLSLIMVAGFYAVFDLENEKQIRINSAYNDLSNLSHAFEEHIHHKLASIHANLQHAGEQFSTNSTRESSFMTWLGRLEKANEYPLFAVVDKNAQPLYAVNRTACVVDARQTDFFTQHQQSQSNQPYFGKPVSCGNPSRFYFPISQRISSHDGTFFGVVFALIDPVFFSDFYQRMEFQDSMFVVVMGTHDFTIRFRQVANDKSLGQVVPNAPVYKHLKSSSSGVFNDIGAVANRSRLMAYHQMQDYPLVVVVGLDEQAFLQPFMFRQSRTHWRIGIISAVFVLITFLLVRAIRRNRVLMQDQIDLKAGQDKELMIAGKIQGSLIPGNADWPDASVATLYLPAAKTSGDFLGYRRTGTNNLRGFVLDTKGHGLAASMYTSAFYVMLNEMLRDVNALDPQILEQVNKKALDYFDADTFAAMILFDFDFSAREMSVVSGGINKFLASAEPSGFISLPGSYVGISDATEFTMIRRGFKSSDAFVFASDGLLDIAPESKCMEWITQPDGAEQMRQWAASAPRRDDIAAISVRIK